MTRGRGGSGAEVSLNHFMTGRVYVVIRFY